MWDFSWLERRYEGGSYEDWNRALDELVERGYDAVRIDAYPHFVAIDLDREWTLSPVFEAYDWGAPATCRVEVMPALTDFITACAERDIAVALSSWFREDETDARLGIRTPADIASVWIDALDYIDDAGLLDTVCWVDLCNEFRFRTRRRTSTTLMTSTTRLAVRQPPGAGYPNRLQVSARPTPTKSTVSRRRPDWERS